MEFKIQGNDRHFPQMIPERCVQCDKACYSAIREYRHHEGVYLVCNNV